MLEDIGCDVVTSATGAEALDLISNDPQIEIVITDINMPKLGGRELAFRAKQMQNHLHVILLSGRESDGYGFPIIRKPFLEADLLRVMSQTSGLC
jgi:CheY-like chemotaxis protein